jgi:hypothetical protein
VSWRLSGTYFENCNCNVTCPCAISGFGEPADNERCLVLLAFQVDSGDIDGVDVSGLSYAGVADAPGAMAEGNWRVGLLHPVSSTLTAARATRSKVRAFGIELDAVGKNGHAAPFSWNG